MTKRNAVLILAATPLLGIAYSPTQAKPKPSREFIEATYIRPTFRQFLQAETARHHEIMAKIRTTRREIKLKTQEEVKNHFIALVNDSKIEKLSIACLEALKATSVERRAKRKNTVLPGIESIPYSLREEYVAAKERTPRIIINNLDEIV